MKDMNKLKKYIIVFIVSIVAFTTIITLGINYYLEKDHQAKQEENANNEITSLEDVNESLSERENILVMGVDYLHLGEKEGQRGTRTDTIMVFSIDPKTKKTFVLSIPRDSRVNIKGHGYDKINHAHSFGGTDLAIQTISDFLQIPIHHYVKVDYNAVMELVDAVGGVEIDIKQDMDYSPLNIHFKKGTQLLNGEDSVKYLRFRSGYANADIGRINVQQDFVQKLMNKIISPSLITNILKYIDILEKNVETNLSKKQMIQIAKTITEVPVDDIRKEVLPGDGQMIDGKSYWIVDEKGMRELLDDLLSDTPDKVEEEKVNNN